MNIKTLNNIQLENINNKELNQLLIENLFPLESKEIKYYTSDYFNRLPNNDTLVRFTD